MRRHPDTVIIVTTNSDYNGCKDINQSVISRMNLVFDVDEPDTGTLVERVMKITKCTDESIVRRMAETVREISEKTERIKLEKTGDISESSGGSVSRNNNYDGTGYKSAANDIDYY